MGVKSEPPASGGAPDLTSLISHLHPQAMSAAAASMAMGYGPAVATGAGPASAVAAYSAANNAIPESAAVPAIPASAVPADLASAAAADTAGAAPTADADTQMEEARQAEMVADNGSAGGMAPPEVAPEVHPNSV